ncbi:V-set and immunoglobulin domain-containing protein 10-like 2 [Aplochiton taeniatus]
MYVGESLTFSCAMNMSSDWEYLWYKDQQDPPLSHTGNSYSISSPDASHSGTYWCRARRGKTTFYTKYSKPRTLRMSAVPVPSLENRTPWLDVFPSERVELSCGVPGSSDWSYTWFRGGDPLLADQTVTMGPDGAALTISADSATHAGEYTCKGVLNTRPVNTQQSAGLSLKIYDEKPKPSLTQDPDFETMYAEETLVLGCAVNISSGWEYLWYKDQQDTPVTNTGVSYAIGSATLTHKGTYRCRARRGKPPFYTEYSEIQSLDIQRRPWARLTLETGWTEVFTTESLALRCDVEGSPEGFLWNYTW